MTPEALLDLFVLSPVGLVEVDEEGKVEVANLAARNLLTPFTRDGTLDDLFSALGSVAPDLAARVRGYAAPRGVIVESIELIAPGVGRGVQLSLVKVSPTRIVAVATDASGLAHARGLVAQLEQRLQAVEGSVRDYAIYTITGEGIVASWSAAAERVHQWSAADMVGRSAAMLLAGDAGGDAHVQEALSLAARNGWSEEEGYRLRSDGSSFWATTIVTALRGADGEAVGFTVVTRDLSERRKFEEAVRDDATSNTDYLTGASTRRAFFDVASSEVARARRYGQPLSLLLVAPDNFRDIVDSHGEEFASEWLRSIANICRQESRTTDVLGRVGGEEFAVLLPSTELSGGLVLAERIRERMQRNVFPGELKGLRCTLSVGVAEVLDEITTVEGLLAASATAVERAKLAGMNLVVGYDV
ncbi:MAG: GGDEF domain-containing protein [Gemmatimonadaceae bacterium]|nr:GGDEF domain-containing protein [Gemmatimonadaceae bacterium]